AAFTFVRATTEERTALFDGLLRLMGRERFIALATMMRDEFDNAINRVMQSLPRWIQSKKSLTSLTCQLLSLEAQRQMLLIPRRRSMMRCMTSWLQRNINTLMCKHTSRI